MMSIKSVTHLTWSLVPEAETFPLLSDAVKGIIGSASPPLDAEAPPDPEFPVSEFGITEKSCWIASVVGSQW